MSKSVFPLSILPLAVLLLTACQTAAPQQPESPTTFSRSKLTEVDSTISGVISSNQIPGGVLWLERNGSAYQKPYGYRALEPKKEPMTIDTIFDVASLTKVLATAPSACLLIERGEIQLEAPVTNYIPEFQKNGKGAVTVRHLLTHTSGLRPGIGGRPPWSGYSTGIELACAEELVSLPGTAFRYSDINFIVLGEIVRRVSGMTLDQFSAREIFKPLGMSDTGFNPSETRTSIIAPTERVEGRVLRGTVHDPTSRRMGGVAGHAGLFTTATDIARFCRMMLNGGELDGMRIFNPETVQLMTSVQSPKEIRSRRGLGWDIDSGYSRPRGKIFPLGSYGHTGFTGTSLWIDPFSRTFWIFLSNRVHPDGKGNVLPLQAALASMVAEAVTGFNFAWVEGALAPLPKEEATERETPSIQTSIVPVLNGIDVLIQEGFSALQGLRVGLITNQTGTDRNRNSTIDLLSKATGVKLVALFSPEHGIRGEKDESVEDSIDSKTGLPIYSLYGEARTPSPEQLANLDALVFDIQDVGCRFYTYISTLGNALEAAGKARLKVFVLDRVNPVNGIDVDGPVLDGDTSFTGFHPIPIRHGMTVGELAKMFNDERGFGANLHVIPVRGWRRELWFDETGLPWTNPSPNMRSLNEATLYPGVGLLETTALSVGRGTDTPFEVVGAPYINDVQLAAELNRLNLSGVRFIPVRFSPKSSVFRGEICLGVNIIVIDREIFRPIDAGIAIAQTVGRLFPREFDIERFNRLLVHRATVEAIRAGKHLDEIRLGWVPDLERFMKRRASFLLY
ncbi:MAG: DUF1343 domain-containing protein [Verrucomicrobia bacterium]|nr:DUF1343 domain-containing protein [Verrucomicrobiota bacterium]